MKLKGLILTLGMLAGAANASLLTDTSGLGLDVTALGASTVGGVVVDLLGTNGSHVVSQLAASELFVGFFNTGTPDAYQGNPGTIGVQSGFTSSVLDSLGGGLAGASFRFTLHDGDTASGNFDYNANFLLVNGVEFGNWSNINAEQTDGNGNVTGAQSGGGFRDNILDTGWFTSTDSGLLASLYSSLQSTNELLFQLRDDSNEYDNHFDFTRGLDQSMIDVGQGPITQPGGQVPEPAPLTVIALGMALLGLLRSRKA
ncbi:hypothetical protein [Bowmanella denitrificans]|uniref:hypothetical protein n=1 Tax=Bowmanella denitrificans TaxID=366582 RepID=UPI000C99A11A|nr:hypothetical protein [Bowmanella denitrificans]